MTTRLLGQLWRHFRTDTLFRNAAYLMASTGVLGVFGFFFWMIVSHLFPVEVVGLATTLISAATLLATLSTLGMNNALIRFLSSSNRKAEHMSTAFTTTTLAAFTVSLGFVFFMRATHILSLPQSWLLDGLFMSFVIVTTYNTLIEGCFIAFREAHYILAKSVLVSILKLMLPLVLAGFGVFGIIGSITAASFAGCILATVWLTRRYKARLRIKMDRKVLNETKRFALGNYIATALVMLPSSVLPLIVARRLGTAEAAFLYMPLMFITLLNVIPLSTGQSLFAEASHDEAGLLGYIGASLKHMLILLVPAVGFIIITSRYLLGFFGAAYATAGASTLRILAVVSLLGAINYLGDAILNVQKRVRTVMLINALNTTMIIGSAYFAAPRGLEAVGVAWLGSQMVTMVVYFVVIQGILKRFSRVRGQVIPAA